MVITAKSAREFFSTNLAHDIFCKGPGGKTVGDKEYFMAGDAHLKPGTPCILKTGAGGHAIVIKPGSNTSTVFGFVGFDKDKIATFDTAYTAGHMIPVYPIDENIGCTFRNIRFEDPNANVNAGSPLACVEDTNQGMLKLAVEAANFVDSDSADGEAFPAGVLVGGDQGHIFSRIVARLAYYLADPGADTYVTVIATRA